MPVPQENSLFVEQASCLFIKGLLTMVQDVSFNRMQAVRRGFKPPPNVGQTS
ncbi:MULTISPECIES: hypothetical protein [unclassified Microcoleus]|uniref:hypothetical protein n=1 Tax=unclassified Microcoleus TaxID=2642155 RepID=UPI002FCEF40F